jgi:hypothetical protein
LNEDGMLDFVTSGTLSIHLGDGLGAFAPFPAPQAPFLKAVTLVDVDGDGHLDFVGISSQLLPMVVVGRGRGDGTFRPIEGYGTVRQGRRLAVRDVTADGRPDLVLLHDCAAEVIINRLPPVGIDVLDLAANRSGTVVRLAWRLSAEALRMTAGVHIERGEVSVGPFERLSSRALLPASTMSFEDEKPLGGRESWYRLVLVGRDGGVRTSIPIEVGFGDETRRTTLSTPFETPGEPGVSIRYTIGRATDQVRLTIYEVRGREVWSLGPTSHDSGGYVRKWNGLTKDGVSVARGIYLVRLDTPTASAMRKFVLMGR